MNGLDAGKRPSVVEIASPMSDEYQFDPSLENFK
jgi:hypothetical protein